MATLEEMANSIARLGFLRRRSRLLPHGVVAAELYVSKQRLSDLIQGDVVATETVCGARLVRVDSAWTFAKQRYQRLSERRTVMQR